MTTKYLIKYSSDFKKALKKISKQGKDIDKLFEVIEKLANKEELDFKYKNHRLVNDKYYTDCGECHIEPDWLLIYRYHENQLILLLVNTGSHSEVFN